MAIVLSPPGPISNPVAGTLARGAPCGGGCAARLCLAEGKQSWGSASAVLFHPAPDGREGGERGEAEACTGLGRNRRHSNLPWKIIIIKKKKERNSGRIRRRKSREKKNTHSSSSSRPSLHSVALRARFRPEAHVWKN